MLVCNVKLVYWSDNGSSKQLPALLIVESLVYRTLAWRSSGENTSLFRAIPLYSFCDAPSPLANVRSPCQFNCVPFCCQLSGLTPAGVLSIQPYPVTCFLNSLLKSFSHGIFFLWTKSCHFHPLRDASRDGSFAANFNREMRCFPPLLITFFNKSLVAMIFPPMRRIDIVFTRHHSSTRCTYFSSSFHITRSGLFIVGMGKNLSQPFRSADTYHLTPLWLSMASFAFFLSGTLPPCGTNSILSSPCFCSLVCVFSFFHLLLHHFSEHLQHQVVSPGIPVQSLMAV